jgi:hypothetical protein
MTVIKIEVSHVKYIFLKKNKNAKNYLFLVLFLISEQCIIVKKERKKFKKFKKQKKKKRKKKKKFKKIFLADLIEIDRIVYYIFNF